MSDHYVMSFSLKSYNNIKEKGPIMLSPMVSGVFLSEAVASVIVHKFL